MKCSAVWVAPGLFSRTRQSGVEPDIIALAKPLAGGLPMGAILVREKIARTIKPGDHATTFGGGPLVSTVALAVLNRIAEPAFLADVSDKADHWRICSGRLLAHPKRKAGARRRLDVGNRSGW